MTQTEHEREIDGHLWSVSLHTGREALTLFRHLSALVAGPIAEAVESAVGDIDIDTEMGAQQILGLLGGAVGIVGQVASKLTDEELLALSARLLKFTRCDNKPIAFDLAFRGAIPTLFKVLAFVVEVNFVGPFAASLGPAVGGVLARLQATPETGSTPPTS